MFIQKSFAGLEPVGSGPETEPKSSGYMTEVSQLLTTEAYNLYEATEVGATIN